MKNASTVEIVPEVLRWARESSGLSRDQAARKLNLFPSEIQTWEDGLVDPTLPHLRRMADVYKRPLAMLLLSQPPDKGTPLPDFRLLPENHGRGWSAELSRAYKRVQSQREALVELAELQEAVPPALDLSLALNQDPEEGGELLRSWLLATARPLPEHGDQFHRWRSLIEQKLILVTHAKGVALREMRGLCIGDQPFPIVLINGKDTLAGKCFTLFHELVHVLLHGRALCDLGYERKRAKASMLGVERFCNHVAAASLMPRTALLQDARVARASPTTTWAEPQLQRLAAPLGVSNEAMLLRLVTLGRASQDEYGKRRRYYLKIYDGLARTERKGGDYYRLWSRDLGRLYINRVLDAYQEGVIGVAEVAEMLDVKAERLAEIEKRFRDRP